MFLDVANTFNGSVVIKLHIHVYICFWFEILFSIPFFFPSYSTEEKKKLKSN